MCLGFPAQIITVYEKENRALVDIMGMQTQVGTLLLKDLAPGIFVLVHAGQAIEKINLEEAEKTLALWKEVLKNEPSL